MFRTSLFLFAILIFSCSTEDVVQKIQIGENLNTVSFNSAFSTVNEGETATIKLVFEEPLTEGGFISIAYTSATAVYGTNFTTHPVPTNDVIILNLAAGETEIEVFINTLTDLDSDDSEIDFSIIGSSSQINYISNQTFTLKINDNYPVIVPDDPEEVLTVVTWNIEQYPKNGQSTINAVHDIITNMDADIIALQEIDDIAAFNSLVVSLDGWEGKLYDVRYGIELGYLFKTSEISSFSNLSIIYNDDSDAFPRQPVIATATHNNGLEVTLINLHLKCCDEGEQRRADASAKLKSYIDDNLPTDNVIVLGDMNDDILSGSPFSNFINDSDNYLFTDMDIATGSSAYWSYPGWPSHLDHILITNELFDNFVSSETLLLNLEVSNYDGNVSDHRPVVVHFTNK